MKELTKVRVLEIRINQMARVLNGAKATLRGIKYDDARFVPEVDDAIRKINEAFVYTGVTPVCADALCPFTPESPGVIPKAHSESCLSAQELLAET